MHIAYKLLFEQVVTQVHKTFHSDNAGFWCKWFQSSCSAPEVAVRSVCSTSISSFTVSSSTCPASVCCDFYFVGLCLTSDHLLHLYALVCTWEVPGGVQDGLSKSQPPDKTGLEEMLEIVEQWAVFDEGGCFWGVSSVSIISSTAEPRRSPVSVPWGPPDTLLVVCGFRSGVRSYHFTDLREGDSCRLGKDLAHFHRATLPFSAKAFTSNRSNPLPKNVFLPSELM